MDGGFKVLVECARRNVCDIYSFSDGEMIEKGLVSGGSGLERDSLQFLGMSLIMFSIGSVEEFVSCSSNIAIGGMMPGAGKYVKCSTRARH